jgi:hypothetical protein
MTSTTNPSNFTFQDYLNSFMKDQQQWLLSGLKGELSNMFVGPWQQGVDLSKDNFEEFDDGSTWFWDASKNQLFLVDKGTSKNYDNVATPKGYTPQTALHTYEKIGTVLVYSAIAALFVVYAFN